MRRVIIFLVLLLWHSSLLADVLVVTLLGTGTPRPNPERGSQAILVEAGNQKLLFDAGRGVAQQCVRVGADLADLDKVFLTHLHYDHIIGLPDLFLSGWVYQRQLPMQVWGGAGVSEHLSNIRDAYSADITWRNQHSGLPIKAAEFIAHEIDKPGIVYSHDGLRVTAFLVDHHPVEPAFGYRIDYRSRSMVISGDTRYSQAVVAHSKSVDLLIHEIAAVSEPLRRANKRLQQVYDYHTTPEDLLRVVKQTRPRMTVLVHQLIFGLKPDAVLRDLRGSYDGEIMLGKDLDAFDVGEQIRVYKR